MGFDRNEPSIIKSQLGEYKFKCTDDSTVESLLEAAKQALGLKNNTEIYALRLPPQELSETDQLVYQCPVVRGPLLCPKLNWEQIDTLYASPRELKLAIHLFPPNLIDAMLNDRQTLFYLSDQIRTDYFNNFKHIKDSTLALQLGCLDIKSQFGGEDDQNTNFIIQQATRSRDLTSYFPPCVIQHYKGWQLRREVRSYLSTISHYSREDCAEQMLDRYRLLLNFDRDTFSVSVMSGWGIQGLLMIGPRDQVSFNPRGSKQKRILAYFVNIRQIRVNKFPDSLNFNISLLVEESKDGSRPPEWVPLSVRNPLDADTIVHLIHSYCKQAANPVNNGDGKMNGDQVVSRDENQFLPQGCPLSMKKSVEQNDVVNQVTAFDAKIDRKAVKIEKVLGEGIYGNVCKGTLLNKNRIPVAVKACRPNVIPVVKSLLLDEADLLAKLSHPHIIKLLGCCRDDPIWLILEYAALGELRQYLIARSTSLPVSLLITYCYQLSSALAYLESQHFVHRDIAVRNVLVADHETVKLSDFGMARRLNENNQFICETGTILPIKWLPPESIYRRIFSPSTDVWMFGVCMWEILSEGQQQPFDEFTNHEAAWEVAKGLRLTQPPLCPDPLFQLMSRCWHKKPANRPRFADLQPQLRELSSRAANSVTMRNNKKDITGRESNDSNSWTTTTQKQNIPLPSNYDARRTKSDTIILRSSQPKPDLIRAGLIDLINLTRSVNHSTSIADQQAHTKNIIRIVDAIVEFISTHVDQITLEDRDVQGSLCYLKSTLELFLVNVRTIEANETARSPSDGTHQGGLAFKKFCFQLTRAVETLYMTLIMVFKQGQSSSEFVA